MNRTIQRGLKPIRFVTGGFVDSDTRPGLILLSAAILAILFANGTSRSDLCGRAVDTGYGGDWRIRDRQAAAALDQ